jgi:peptidoglycan/xylan/chitin deacetylase (PgdA/CDA1 family)
VPALMYHDVVPAGAENSSGFPGRDAALYKIAPDMFDAHLGAIISRLDARNRRYHFRRSNIPCAPVAMAAEPAAAAGRHAAAITFDDGGISALVAADMLERHGLLGHFFVTVNYLGTPGFLTERDVRDLRRRRHTIGSHSCSHPLRMGHCSWTQLLDEWTRSRAVLANVLGEEVIAASVPGGDCSPTVAEAAAAAGFTELFTSEPVLASRRAHGLTLHGRFIIRRWTSPAAAAALAAGDRVACARQAIVWNVKKFGKHVGGGRYLQLRKLILGHGNEVRWGDQP